MASEKHELRVNHPFFCPNQLAVCVEGWLCIRPKENNPKINVTRPRISGQKLTRGECGECSTRRDHLNS